MSEDKKRPKQMRQKAKHELEKKKFAEESGYTLEIYE